MNEIVRLCTARLPFAALTRNLILLGAIRSSSWELSYAIISSIHRLVDRSTTELSDVGGVCRLNREISIKPFHPNVCALNIKKRVTFIIRLIVLFVQLFDLHYNKRNKTKNSNENA